MPEQFREQVCLGLAVWIPSEDCITLVNKKMGGEGKQHLGLI